MIGPTGHAVRHIPGPVVARERTRASYHAPSTGGSEGACDCMTEADVVVRYAELLKAAF